MRIRSSLLLKVGLILAWAVLGWLGRPAPLLAAGPGNLWQSFIVGDGVPSGNIFSIVVAQDGTLWFGTDAGAGHYDGAWHSLTSRDGLPSDRVRAIVQTEDGTLWFGTSAGLIRSGSNGTPGDLWTTANGLPDDDVHTLIVQPQSSPGSRGPGVWVGTKHGVAYVDGERVVPDSPVPGADVQAMTLSARGELLVSVAGEGVWQRGQEGTWQKLGDDVLVDFGPLALWADRDGRIWAGIQTGLTYYQDGQWHPYPLSDGEGSLSVLAILQDSDGNLWAGTDRGAINVRGASLDSASVIQFRAQQDGLVNDHVRAMTLDRDGGLWFGTIGGVSRYAGTVWREIGESNLALQRINTLLTDRAGRTWVGMEYNGLALWDGDKWQFFTTANGLPDDRVLALFEDEVGHVWISTGAGVGYLSPSEAFRFRPVSGSGPVYGFEQDSNGTLWLAADDGLYRWTQSSGLAPVSEFAGKRVNAVHQATDGALWVGTQTEGVLRFTGDSWQAMSSVGAAKSLFNDIVVNGIVETVDGSMWVGTYNDGLWRYRAGRWVRMDVNLTSPKILALKTAGRILWVGTRQGLAGYDGLSWQTYNGDVLPDPGVLTLAPGKDGTLWIGTMAGLVHYYPDTTPPWVTVESVNLLSPQDGKVHLGKDVIQAVRVRGGDLTTSAANLVFLTQLDGVDVTPLVNEDTQITVYDSRKLPAGTYKLRVRARDASFNYSAPAEMQIIVPVTVTLPGGFRLNADVFYPMLVLGMLAMAGVATAGSVSLRARARDRRLANELAARQREALERAFNPYISGEPVRQPEMFFARDELLRRIFNALHQNSIMIHGERRMGKTTLLYQLAEQLRQAEDAEWAFVPVYVDLEGTLQTHFFYSLMDVTWGALQAYTLEDPPHLRFNELWPEEYTDREFATDLKLILENIKEVVAPRKVRVILLLDEMDVVNSYDTVIQQQLRRIFMSSLALNLGAVVAGTQISKAWDREESPWYNMFNEIPLEPFTDDQARQLLIEPVRGIYEWDPEAIEFVLRHAEGRPYRLQQCALEAVNQMLAARRVRIVLEDVQAAHEITERARTG